jgi:Domain of unknown function (DUF222)/HNH endonuclease
MRDDPLVSEILRLCADIHRAEFRLLELIGELDAQRPWRHETMPSAAHWLNAHCGIDLVTAREKVRIARALPELPAIRSAFRDGELSYSKVRALTRIADRYNEAELVAMARVQTAAQVEREVKARRQAERLQESQAAFTAYRHRGFTCHYDETGAFVFEGRLPAEQGALLLTALDRAMEWLFQGELDRVPQAVRRADALAALAERFLGQPPVADAGMNTADRFQVTVHASAESLPEFGDVDPDDPPCIEDGPVLATETVRRLTCDSALVRILTSGAGEPLDIGRKTRVIPAAIRRALQARDRGCRFPGCTNTRFVDGHHIRHWGDGGATRLDNLVLLCRHHHRLLHEGGYYVVRDGPRFIFCRGDGELVEAACA